MESNYNIQDVILFHDFLHRTVAGYDETVLSFWLAQVSLSLISKTSYVTLPARAESQKEWGLGTRDTSPRPHCFVVRLNVQGRDVGINSELSHGEQSSGPGWTNAQRGLLPSWRRGRGREVVEQTRGQTRNYALRVWKPGSLVALNKSFPINSPACQTPTNTHESKGRMHLTHCCIFVTLNSPWHMLATLYFLKE